MPPGCYALVAPTLAQDRWAPFSKEHADLQVIVAGYIVCRLG